MISTPLRPGLNCSLPFTARNDARPRATAGRSAPVASAAAAAASAFRTLCTPGICSVAAARAPSAAISISLDAGPSRYVARTSASAPVPKDAHAALARDAGPVPVMRIVAVQHRDAVVGERAQHRRVLGGDLLDALHEFLVLALRVVDHGDRRAGDAGEVAGLARVVHPDLEHRNRVLLAQPQRAQGQPDVVVQVAERRGHLPLAEVRAQGRRKHLLHGGLAVRADDRDDRDAEPAAPVLGERAEGEARVPDRDEREPGRRPGVAADSLDHRRGGAALARRAEILVSVEALAAERHEERPGLDRAAVGRHRREAHVAADDVRPERGGGCGEEHHGFHPASALRASSVSENGTRRPVISW